MNELNNQGRHESNIKYSNIALIGVYIATLSIFLLSAIMYFIK